MTAESTSADQISSLAKIEPKMRLEGTITDVGLHGAIVDLGLAAEGLLHISQLAADGEINHVTDAVRPGDHVTVWVTDVEPDRHRVSLTMVKPPALTWDELAEGQVHTGTVARIESYGAFVDIGAERHGLLHVREMSAGYVEHPSEMVSVGDEIDVRVLKVDRRRRRIDLTKQGLEAAAVEEPEPEEPEEEEEAAQTSMEAALERAYSDQEQPKKRAGKPRLDEDRSDFIEREEILKRTLDEQSGSE